MSVGQVLRRVLKNIPEPMARPLAYIPFSFRLGFSYKRSAASIRDAEIVDSAVLDAKRLIQLRSILHAAVKEVDFYRDFYRNKGFSPNDLRTLADWKQVPVVSKSDLQSVPLTARCTPSVRIHQRQTNSTLAFFDSGMPGVTS